MTSFANVYIPPKQKDSMDKVHIEGYCSQKIFLMMKLQDWLEINIRALMKGEKPSTDRMCETCVDKVERHNNSFNDNFTH